MLLVLLRDDRTGVTRFCGDATGSDEVGWGNVLWGPNLFRDRGSRELQRFALLISAGLASSRNVGLPPFPLATSAPAIFIGAQRFTPWEACCEILRRAIEHLEKR
jgi:hypothetical protein